MAMTFDATLKEMGRDSPLDFLATFDRPAAVPVKLLNVDLSTVTTSADLILGLGDPLEEIIHLDFQASASAGKHGDVLAYNALVFRHYLVPVHSIVLLLRPEAAHSNLNGRVGYAPRAGRGNMNFTYEVVPLWQRPVEELLAGPLGVVPLAILGRLPEDLSLEDGLTAVARRMAERIEAEVPGDRARKLLTEALLLAGLRVRRDAAARIFAGVRIMSESDTYLAIVDEGQEKALRTVILRYGEKRGGASDEAIRARLSNITDLERLNRMLDRAVEGASWQEILDTP